VDGREVAIYRQRVVGSFQQIYECKSKQASQCRQRTHCAHQFLAIKKHSRFLRTVLNEHSESMTIMRRQPICLVNRLIVDGVALAS
jgi:hypothetical protein